MHTNVSGMDWRCLISACMQTSGEVDQSAGMLSDDVREKGYALMCVSTPLSDCVVQEITEAEILDEQLCA
jgi:ferredoxin